MSNDTGNSSSGNNEISMPHMVRFWVLLPPEVASTFCTLIVLITIFLNRKLRSSVKNHVLVVLLIFALATQLIDIPFYLNLMLHSSVTPASSFACLLWIFVDVGLYNGTLILMMWMAFERHIIVFHDRWISIRERCIVIHYIPLSIIICYVFVYYIYVYIFYPCENQYDYTSPYCGLTSCFLDNEGLRQWETYMNNLIPSLLEPVFTIGFLLRVIWSKCRSNQRVRWHKQRKMTLQLLSISLPNIVINGPITIFYIAYACGVPLDWGTDIFNYFFFFCYFITFILPFTCLLSILDVKKIIKKIICRRSRRLVRATATVRPERRQTNIVTQF